MEPVPIATAESEYALGYANEQERESCCLERTKEHGKAGTRFIEMV